jgi:hypothetical protein
MWKSQVDRETFRLFPVNFLGTIAGTIIHKKAIPVSSSPSTRSFPLFCRSHQSGNRRQMHQSKTGCLLLCASDGELEGQNNSCSHPGPSVSFDASTTASDLPGTPAFCVNFRELLLRLLDVEGCLLLAPAEIVPLFVAVWPSLAFVASLGACHAVSASRVLEARPVIEIAE